jgi:hypothetical protein
MIERSTAKPARTLTVALRMPLHHANAAADQKRPEGFPAIAAASAARARARMRLIAGVS